MIKIYCECCGKEMICDLKHFARYPRIYLHKDGRNKRIPICSEECEDQWKKQYFVEEYKGNKIYCIDGKYVPYFDCSYYFTTLEDCKKRIDMPNIGFCRIGFSSF